MKNFFKKVVVRVKKHPIIYGAILVILIIIIATLAFKKGNGTERVQVAQGSVVETVQAAGKTKPAQDVNLGFVRGGKIDRVSVKIGDMVNAGDTLVTLDQREEYANLLRAQADLASETSRLEELKQTISLGGVNTSSSDVALRDAKNNVIEKIRSAYTNSDDSIRNYADQFFNGAPPSFTFKDYFVENGATVYLDVNYDLKASLLRQRTQLSLTLSSWSRSISGLNQNSDAEQYLFEAKTNLAEVRSFLEGLSLAINRIEVTNNEYRSTIVGFKNDVSTARSTVNAAISSVNEAEEKYNSARLSSSGNPQTISAQESKVGASRASVQASEAALSQMVIRAPFAGLVTDSPASAGEIVSSGETVISLISQNNLEIESNVSEVNIGKVNIGNPVQITLDAFPGQQISGKVSYVEPAATIVDNVVTYKVTVAIDEQNSDLKSGLTANLAIETNRKDDVLNIPQYAVINREGKTFVKKVENKEVIEKEIVVGTRGSNGMVEVVSGISAGDTIEIDIKPI